MTTKIKHGQFFTTHNPFNHPEFKRWLTNSVKLSPQDIILEPFAGSNNLVKMLQDTGINNPFQSFDIEPQDDNIVQRDTIADFPTGHRVVITNPPYLSKPSATKKGYQIDMEDYGDLYQLALDRCIDNSEYTAAIIPLSFINSGFFRECLQTVISLPVKMFQDTDCPVCLTMFHNWTMEDGGTPYEDFMFWIGEVCVGFYSELNLAENYTPELVKIKFNDPNGQIGLYALDDAKSPTIRFCHGAEIPADVVKNSSRSITRIALEVDDVDDIITRANKILNRHRQSSGDTNLTPFMGLRTDGQYRQRLSYGLAEQIINMAVAGWGS